MESEEDDDCFMDSLPTYIAKKYRNRKSPIIIVGLLEAIFFAFILDAGSSCSLVFKQLFFILGTFYCVKSSLDHTKEYYEMIKGQSTVKSVLEKFAVWLMEFMDALLKICLNFILLLYLGYYVIMFMVHRMLDLVTEDESIPCRNYQERSEDCIYCQPNLVRLAVVTFSIHVSYIFSLVNIWVMVWVLKNPWVEERLRNDSGTSWYRVLPFFDDNIGSTLVQRENPDSLSGAILGLMLSIPDSTCQIYLIDMFIYAGIMLAFDEILEDSKTTFITIAGKSVMQNKGLAGVNAMFNGMSAIFFIMEIVLFAFIIVVIKMEWTSVANDLCFPGFYHITFLFISLYPLMLICRLGIVCCYFYIQTRKSTRADSEESRESPDL